MIRYALLFAVSISTVGLTAVPVDVSGVARLGGRPLMHAVVWLDVPDAPRPFRQGPIDRSGVPADPHMLAVQVGMHTPFYAVSDDTGRFTIPNVPPGRYVYHAWRPGGEVLNDQVTIGPGRAFEVRWR